MNKEGFHWADDVAERVIKERGNKKIYTCAAGITPSGTVHIGNFREIITVDLVVKALNRLGKKTRFIYSWDDYDVFRKIPANMPKQDLLQKYLRKPIVNTPDTVGCHKSYAEHNEKEVEDVLPLVGVNPEFLYQSKKYKNCEYADEIKFILNNKERIREILNKLREEPLPKKWYPLSVYCEKCNTDETKVIDYDNNYIITYECKCGFKDKIDFRKKGIVKLPWRQDWLMRQHYEKVDFEPAGKEHYQQPGGSRITSNEIYEALYKSKHPIDLKYDFVILKGVGGKMSSSLGNVITLKDCLDIYEPEIIRWFFASTRPNTEFFISFDMDIIKNYEDYDRLERDYYGNKLDKKQQRIYELSQIELKKKQPEQIQFRHLVSLVQIYNRDINKLIKELKTKDKRIENRIKCAINWIDKYAPDEMKFELQDEVKTKFNEKEIKALKLLAVRLKKKYTEDKLAEEIYNVAKETGIEPKEFFKIAYKLLINKERGPRLASFILTIGPERVIKLINQV